MQLNDRDFWRLKGEQDRAHHKCYQKPHGIFNALFTWTVAGLRKREKDNNAYHYGWHYTNNGAELLVIKLPINL